MDLRHRSRAFTFTVNDWSPEQRVHLETVVAPKTRYMVFGEEVAPTTGMKHLQGWCYFNDGKSLRAVSKLIPHAHIEAMRASAARNTEYCTKGENVFRYGVEPHQGKRFDLDRIKEKIIAGTASIQKLVFRCLNYQQMRMVETLMRYQPAPERDPPEVIWHYGASGTGKTRDAIQKAGSADKWISSGKLQWWDGYTGQEVVILDDLRPEDTDPNKLLRLLDRYPVRVETKGSSQWLRAKKIIVTSPMSPARFFERITFAGEATTQLVRRVTRTVNYDALEAFEWPSEDVLA